MVFEVRENMLIADEIIFHDSRAYIDFNPGTNTFCFNIWTTETGDGSKELVHVFCAGLDGITSEMPIHVCIINEEPINVSIPDQPIEIITMQTILVDTGLTAISVNNWPDVWNITTEDVLEVEANITSINISNWPDSWEVTSTSSIPVNTFLTDISISNWPVVWTVSSELDIPVETHLENIFISNLPDIFVVTTTGIIDVDTLLTDIGISNWPDEWRISSTVDIPVETHLVDIEISNFPDVWEITASSALLVDTLLTDIGISNWPDVWTITGDAVPLPVDTGLTEIAVGNWPNPLIITSETPLPVETLLTEINISNWPDEWIISSTVAIPVETHLVELAISNIPDPLTITTEITLPVETHLTMMGVNNWPTVWSITDDALLNVDTGLVEIAVSNWDDLIGSTLTVDTGLTEIAVSNFDGTINADIVAQTHPNLQMQSNSENIATEATLSNILSILTGKSTNPYEEKLYGIARSVYHSNYHNNLDFSDMLYEFTDFSIGAVVTPRPWGIELLTDDEEAVYCKFFPYKGGRTLSIITIGTPFLESLATMVGTSYLYRLGVETMHRDFYICLLVRVTNTPLLAATIEIEFKYPTLVNFAGITDTVISSDFNIDKLDGTGPSGFTLPSIWYLSKFFVLSDEADHFILGICDGFRFIPVHSIFYNNVDNIINGGSPLIQVHRPFFSTKRVLGPVGTYILSGFEVLKDCLPAVLSSRSIDIPATQVNSSSYDTLIIMRYRVTGDYNGNIQITELSYSTNNTISIEIRVATDSVPFSNIVNPSYSTNGNLIYEVGLGQTYGLGGRLIYTHYTNANVGTLDLRNVINWRMFQEGLTPSRIQIGIQRYTGGFGNSSFAGSLHFEEF